MSDPEVPSPIRSLSVESDITALELSSDGKNCAVASRNGLLSIFPNISGKSMLRSSVEMAFCTSIRFSPKATLICVILPKKTGGLLQFLNSKGEIREEIEIPGARCVDFSNDGRLIGVGSEKGTVSLLKPSTTKTGILPFLDESDAQFGGKPIIEIVLASSQKYLAYAQQDGLISLRDIGDRTVWFEKKIDLELTAMAMATTADPRGERVAVGSKDGKLVIIDIGTRERITEMANLHDGAPIIAVSLHNDASLLASVDDRGRFSLFDIRTGESKGAFNTAVGLTHYAASSKNAISMGFTSGIVEIYEISKDFLSKLKK